MCFNRWMMEDFLFFLENLSLLRMISEKHYFYLLCPEKIINEFQFLIFMFYINIIIRFI